jgi:uncharacterized circularly permuted ATP-grasp superfamily protein
MLRDAVDFYHELLAKQDVATASRQALDEGLERTKLIFGGRPLTPFLRPHFVTAMDWARAVGICETVWSALQKVKDAAVVDDSILDELGVFGFERELVRIDPGYRRVSPSARLDSFLTENAYSFVELNGECPAGVAYSDSASEIFETLPVMKRFSERYGLRRFHGRPKLLSVLLEAYEEFLGRAPEKKPSIAIVDLKDLPTQKEFELFKEFFEANGHAAVICSPEELDFRDGRLLCGDFAVDIVYKRLLVNEYLPIIESAPALLDAYRAGAVCMVNSFVSKIIHKKAVFAVLTDERYEKLFSDDELAAMTASVPWTRKFREEKTFNRASEVDLVEWTRSNRSKLVLKPNDDYGGHGIYIGWTSSESEWDDAIAKALGDGDYLVQERVETSKEEFPMLLDGGGYALTEQLVDLDPLLFNGKVGGAFTRLSSTELANVSSGGGMVPTFVIDEK